jgi:hypothetical protein
MKLAEVELTSCSFFFPFGRQPSYIHYYWNLGGCVVGHIYCPLPPMYADYRDSQAPNLDSHVRRLCSPGSWVGELAAYVITNTELQLFLFFAWQASSVGGLFVSCWTLAGRMPVAGPSAAQVPLIPFASCMVLIFALHFLSAATSFWPTRFVRWL